MKHAFPESSGFSHRNLGYMKAFAQAYEDLVFLQEILVYIPWSHHIQLLHRVKDLKKREFYLRGTLEYGWSRNVLLFHVDNHLYERKGKALTNFTKTLPPPQSDLAQQILKDPYNFSFLSLEKEAKERDIEQALMKHVERFLLELGTGFALVGRQYRIEVGEKDRANALKFVRL